LYSGCISALTFSQDLFGSVVLRANAEEFTEPFCQCDAVHGDEDSGFTHMPAGAQRHIHAAVAFDNVLAGPVLTYNFELYFGPPHGVDAALADVEWQAPDQRVTPAHFAGLLGTPLVLAEAHFPVDPSLEVLAELAIGVLQRGTLDFARDRDLE